MRSFVAQVLLAAITHSPRDQQTVSVLTFLYFLLISTAITMDGQVLVKEEVSEEEVEGERSFEEVSEAPKRLKTVGELRTFLEAKDKDFLTKSPYQRVDMDAEAIWGKNPDELGNLFKDIVEEMRTRIEQGEQSDEVYYDDSKARIMNGALQGIYTMTAKIEDGQPEALESLIAGGFGTFGIGPILPLLKAGLNKQLHHYLYWKIHLDIKSVTLKMANFPHIVRKVDGTYNLRAVDFMFSPIVLALYNEGNVAEMTEYTDDDWFPTFFGTDGTLQERLTSTLLPVLVDLEQKGVRLWADDVKPRAIYKYDDKQKFQAGEKIETHYATLAEMVFSEPWFGVWERVKFSPEFVIHAFRLSSTTGEDYAKVPLYLFKVKDSAEFVANVQGLKKT